MRLSAFTRVRQESPGRRFFQRQVLSQGAQKSLPKSRACRPALSIRARVDPSSGLVADSAPPFKLYPANTNHTAGGVDPFAASRFEERWYRLASEQARAHGSKHACQCGLSDAPTCDR